MAYRNGKFYGKNKPRKRKKSSYSELEKLAYNLGKINRGLKNPNTRVFASYKNGCTGKTANNTKPLY